MLLLTSVDESCPHHCPKNSGQSTVSDPCQLGKMMKCRSVWTHCSDCSTRVSCCINRVLVSCSESNKNCTILTGRSWTQQRSAGWKSCPVLPEEIRPVHRKDPKGKGQWCISFCRYSSFQGTDSVSIPILSPF